MMSVLIRKQHLSQTNNQPYSIYPPLYTGSTYLRRVLHPFLLCLLLRRHNLLHLPLMSAASRAGKNMVSFVNRFAVFVFEGRHLELAFVQRRPSMDMAHFRLERAFLDGG